MKIKFNSDDDFPLNKQLKFHNIAITIRFVFEEDGNLYPQVFLEDTFGTFVTIGILKILVLNMNLLFVMDAMI